MLLDPTISYDTGIHLYGQLRKYPKILILKLPWFKQW